MKITQEQFNKAQKTFSKKSLSDTQKQSMLSKIYFTSEVATTSHLPGLFHSRLGGFRAKALATGAIIALLVSGTSYASAMSLPGDLLYGMKVNVLEPIGLTLRLSEESKNEYRILLLEKRVEELERLRQRGEIGEESQKKSAEAANKNIKELESSAIFDEKGENADVSEKVNNYNNLIDATLKIETNMQIDVHKNLDVIDHAPLKEQVGGDAPEGINIPASVNVRVNIEAPKKENFPLNSESDVNINGGIGNL